MKRMTLIALTLCVLILTTIGAGAVMAQQETKTSQGAEAPQKGKLGCVATKIEADSYSVALWGKVYGKVTTRSGEPVPANGKIGIWTDAYTSHRADLVAMTNTTADGSFSYTKAFWYFDYTPCVVYTDPSGVYCQHWRFANGAPGS